MSRQRRNDLLATAIGIVLIGALIQAAGALKHERLVFPDALTILRAFFRLLGEPATYRMMGTSLRHLLEALIISLLIGVPLGLLEGLNRFARHLLKPFISFIRAIPMIVLIIMVMVLADYSAVPAVAAVLMLLPMISEATMEGCRSIPQQLIDVYKMNADLNLMVIFRVYLPLMRGYLREAFTEAVGTGMKLVITAEYMVQTRNSLGKAVFSSSYFNDYEDIYAYALLMVLMILILSEVPTRAIEFAGKKRESSFEVISKEKTK